MTVHDHKRVVDAAGILSLTSAACAIVAFKLPAAAGVLAGAAIAFALASRRRLRRNPTLRGGRVALLGFLLGAAVAIVEAVPILISYVLLLIGALAHV